MEQIDSFKERGSRGAALRVQKKLHVSGWWGSARGAASKQTRSSNNKELLT